MATVEPGTSREMDVDSDKKKKERDIETAKLFQIVDIIIDNSGGVIKRAC